MKKIILFSLFSLLSLWLFSGCSFLRGGQDDLSDQEFIEEDDASFDDELVIEEDSEDFEDLDEEYEDDDDDEDEDVTDLEEDLDELVEEEDKKKGFFARLFGGNEDSAEDKEALLDDEDALFDDENIDFIGEDSDISEVDRDFENYEIVEKDDDTDMSEEDSEYEIVEENNSNTEEETADITDLNQIADSGETQTDSTQKSAGNSETQPDSTDISSDIQTETPKRKSLNKVLQYPYNKANFLINAVYIARPNEDIKTISQKIYGQDKSNELFKINTHLKNRSVVVGDKIYYNSPNRPNDNTKLLFYYEDNNLPASSYTINAGENIRDVAYNLIGHPKSWKEIWSTNPELQSKSEMTQNVNIRYWPQDQMASQQQQAQEIVAQSDPQMPDSEPIPTNNQGSDEELPPSFFDDKAPNNEFYDEQNGEDSFPKPLSLEEKKQDLSVLQEIIHRILQNIEVFGMLVFLVIIFLIFRLIMRKRNQRDFDYTATNIEI